MNEMPEDAPGSYDLHTHSAVSDGTEAPATVVSKAHAMGLAGIALTDHDTVAGLGEARTQGHADGIEVIPGIELSTRIEGRSLHMLALWIDPEEDSELLHELERVRRSRRERARLMVEAIARDYPITWEHVRSIAAVDTPRGGTIGRPHIADALVACGAISNRSEAFDRILAPHSSYYLPYRSIDALHAIRLIHDARGISIAAHPLSTMRSRRTLDMRHLTILAGHGLDGFEVRHREHGPRERAALTSLAHDHGVVTTGGSDYHGAGKPNALGENTTSRIELDQLRERCG